MTATAERLARPDIMALKPFDTSAAQNKGFPPNAIRLDANESPFAPLVGGPLSAAVNRYPEPQPARLAAAMAALYGVAPENLFMGRGSDDAIDALCRAFVRAGVDKAVICPPTFGAYSSFLAIQGAQIVESPLGQDFAFETDRFIAEMQGQENLKLAFLCSPMNPTGNGIDPADVRKICAALPDTIIVMDEAYIEFSGRPSMAAECLGVENLVVLRTLSKAFGLAGARVGAGIAPASTIAILKRVMPPYPIPSLSVEAAVAALSPSRRAVVSERIATLLAERDRVEAALKSAPGVRRVYPSEANFLFLDVEDPDGLAEKLRAAGVRARFRPMVCPGGLRISIGTPEENDIALAAFGVAPSGLVDRRASVVRDTKETKIAVSVNLDDASVRKIETGIPFFDHMLEQTAAHGGFSLTLGCEGDLEIDAHHTIEDCAIALGQALRQALGDKAGIARFGFALPMDEAEAQVLVDLSGRPYAVFEGQFDQDHIGDYPTQMTEHVFKSLAEAIGAAIHVKIVGENDHHKTEAAFKAFGRTLRQAFAREGGTAAPSTKGMLA